jgi:hypothetical protein
VPKRQHGQPRVHAWDVASDVLKSQSGQEGSNPTDNQIANYLLEAKKLNPRVNFNRLKPGETINLPPTVRGGTDTAFGEARRADEGQLTKLQGDLTAAKAGSTEAGVVENAYKDYAKYYQSKMNTPLPGIEQAGLNQILAQDGDQMPANTKKGLEYLRDNWDKLTDFMNPKGGSDGNTPAITDTSLASGVQARKDALTASQSALDQTGDKTIAPQAQWRGDQIKAAFARANENAQSVNNWAEHALEAYATHKPAGSPDGITPDALAETLKSNDLSATDKKYLGWVQKSWGKL